MLKIRIDSRDSYKLSIRKITQIMGEKVMQCQAKARSGAPVFISVAHLSDCCRGLGDGLAATAANQAIIGLSGRAIIGKSPESVKQKPSRRACASGRA